MAFQTPRLFLSGLFVLENWCLKCQHDRAIGESQELNQHGSVIGQRETLVKTEFCLHCALQLPQNRGVACWQEIMRAGLADTIRGRESRSLNTPVDQIINLTAL